MGARVILSAFLQVVLVVVAMLSTSGAQAASARQCPDKGVWLQVLGAGGPEIEDMHASTGYLVWIDGKARLLVDIGGGAALRFAEAKANFADLDAIAFSHFHVDHSAGLPVLLKSAFFGERNRDLPVFGPVGRDFMPSTEEFLNGLFGAKAGIYRYLSSFVTPGEYAAFHLKPASIPVKGKSIWRGFANKRLKLSAVGVRHGPLPALAWRVDIGKLSVTFSGDMSGRADTLPSLAHKTDILVAHNAIPQSASGFVTSLHMRPSVIGRIAAGAGVKALVLSHRMRRTFGVESETLAQIRKSYQGPTQFAEDLQCFKVEAGE